MKQINLYSMCVAAMLAATACSDDWTEQTPATESGQGQTVWASASFAPQTRIIVEDCDTLFNYYWTGGEAFTVFDAQHQQQTLFHIDPSTMTGRDVSALFSGTPDTPYEAGQQLIAVYNGQGGQENPLALDENGNLTLDLTGQNGMLRDEYQFLYGEATYSEEGKLSFNFQHLITTLRLQIRVPDGVTEIHNVRLQSDNLVPKATLVLNKAPHDAENRFKVGDLVYSYSDNGNPSGYLDIQGSFIPVDGIVTLYAYVLDAQLYNDDQADSYSGITPVVLMNDQNGRELASATDYGYKTELKGNVYSLPMEDWIEMVDFDNEATVQGMAGDPYEIANADQFYSLMMRTRLLAKNQQGIPYECCSYKLTDDIQLDGRVQWKPINLNFHDYSSWECIFDGNGKTIGGAISISNEKLLSDRWCAGIFGHVLMYTFKNLNLSLFVEVPQNAFISTVGTLAGTMNGCKVIHCMTDSKMEIHSGYSVGGLVGQASNTQFLYCGFHGSISLIDTYDKTCGGIVGSLTSQTKQWGDQESEMKGCYSGGWIETDSALDDQTIIGGCAGETLSVEADPVIIHYCWATMNVAPPADSRWIVGGLVGVCVCEDDPVSHCYWQSTETNPLECYGSTSLSPTLEACEPFDGYMPTEAQIQALNEGIAGSGYEFSLQDGRLTKVNSGTTVPPSDIEEW